MIDIDKLFTREDGVGNVMTCINGNVHLELASEDGKVRRIGGIWESKLYNGIVYRKHVTAKNIFRKYNAWGINWEIFDKVDRVILKTTAGKKYTVETKKIDKKFLYFKNEGFEKQVFIDLDKWEKT